MLLSPWSPPSSAPHTPLGLGRKAEPVCLQTLRLCSHALAIKRRPITIVIVVVITVVISKQASAGNFTGSSAVTSRIDRHNDPGVLFFPHPD